MDAKRLSVASALLTWYDAHRRDLPWRAKPGETPDPYRVWVSEVMLQQTTVATVRSRFTAWTTRWPTAKALATATEADVMAAWAGLGYYARARNLHAAAKAVAALGGFPRTEAELRALPGLGAYTAAAVAAIAFGERAVVVDANVERVVSRLFAIAAPLPGSRPAIRAAADELTPTERAGDFAQGMMDLGATICTPRRPRCLLCPVRAWCDAFATGEPDRFPVKQPKPDRPQRHGTAFWLEHGGRVLLHHRPPRGLLGGMRALPTGPWTDEPPGLADAPGGTGWRLLPATVEHGFTHFRLQLALAVGEGSGHEPGEWWPIAELDGAGLPTVFRRAAEALRSGR
ncbi:A/G-specific adenine glycosylase [uncultured Sphingomonas sp.]|uniref:A/G-specific adenine glycosylase n=1 Tax=uncultured Sphingomonas sp. TaxID=158754 RepID=UPI0035CC02FE